MMSFALMGCLIFGASDAMAQGRSRSQGGSTSSRSQSAAVSRSSNTSAPTMSRDHSASRSSATPQVKRSSSTSTTRSSATPQVNRSSSTSTTRSSATPQVNRSSSTSTTRSSATPQVNRSSSTSTTRSSATPQVNRSSSTSTSSDRSSRQSTAVRTEKTTTPATSSSGSRTGHGAMTRGGDNSSITHSTNVAPRDNNERTMTKPEATTKRDNRSDGVKPGNGGKHDNGGKPGGGKPDNGGKPGGGHHDGKPGGGHHDGKHGGRGYGPDHRYDYNSHPHRDAFSWNYSHHSWSRPLPPPVRPYRPAPWVWYRPTIPVGWHPYAGAPVIDRILGLVFGSLYDASLDHLYYSGYYIDGYADGIIYLRDVPMLSLYWPDVMLNYDYNRLVNAQFVYHTRYYDTSRYDMVYNSLRRIYGSPVYRDGMVVSWYGGDSRGYVTLSMVDSPDGYYTTMSIGY